MTLISMSVHDVVSALREPQPRRVHACFSEYHLRVGSQREPWGQPADLRDHLVGDRPLARIDVSLPNTQELLANSRLAVGPLYAARDPARAM